MTNFEMKNHEIFIPSTPEGNLGKIIQLQELQREHTTLINITQYQALREAEKEGGYLLSLAEDFQITRYAQEHKNEDFTLKKFYDSFISNMQYARWTRTQVHYLNSDCPLVVRISKVHPEFDFATMYKKEIIAAPWLPKKSGYIQRIDERTGLPLEIGNEPNPELHNTYFLINPTLNVAAPLFNKAGSQLILHLDRDPSFFGNGLGLRLVKHFDLEKQV